MNKLSKIVSAIAFSGGILLASIGYAAMSDSLHINGSASAAVQDGVFIVSATTNDADSSITGYMSNTLSSIVNLDNNASSTVSIEITMYNNGNETYGYNATKYLISDDTYSNSDIVFELSIERRTPIEANSYITFECTFKYAKNINITNTSLLSVLSFEFVPIDEIPEDEGEIAVNGALDAFKEILNTTVSYEDLISQMGDYSNNDRYDESYIGNVNGASPEDVELLDELFAGNLFININGKETEVRLMIKLEDLDGKSSTGDESGKEMTIYLTTDDLARDSWWSSGSAPVYAATFTKIGDEEWSQIGPMFEGTATIKGYDGNIFGEGSFDTDTWKTTNANGQTANQTIENAIKPYL